MNTDIKAVFFDLDGTLLDTARDFAHAINILLELQNKPLINFDLFREHIYGESRRMIAFAFDIKETDPQFEPIRKQFLETYCNNATEKTVFFEGMDVLLDTLDANRIAWGIITNKPTWLTTPIVKHFELDKRAVCILSGDTLAKSKPDPLPLLHACELAEVSPADAVYVGDSQTDVLAAKNAGMRSIAVTFGYPPPGTVHTDWQADFTAQSADEIMKWIGVSEPRA